MSASIDDIEDAVEFVDKWEQVMKAERVLSKRFNHVDTNHNNCISTKVPFPITYFNTDSLCLGDHQSFVLH